MASNFNPSISFSPVGLLGIGNESINDLRIFHSSLDQSSSSLDHRMWEGASGLNFDSNLGNTQLGSLVSHRVTEVTRTFVSPLRLGSVQQQLFPGAIDHISLRSRPAAFPPSDHITVSREVVETICFVASSSTLDCLFGYSQSIRNPAIFPTSGFSVQAQPTAVGNHYNQIVHPFLSESTSVNQVTPPFPSESTPSMNQVIRTPLSLSAPSMSQVMNPSLTESSPSLIIQEALNYVSDPATVPGNQNIETVFDAAPDVYLVEQPTSRPLAPLAVNLQNPDHNLNNSNYYMNESYVKPIREVRIVELSDDEIVSDHAVFPGKANRETVFNDAPGLYPAEVRGSHPLAPLAVNLQNPSDNLNDSNYNMKHCNVKPIRQAMRIVELSDDENAAAAADYPLGNDGRIHSLINPDGTYGCPICSASCDSAQTFGSHIQLHYQMDESAEERNRRMAAKCRHKKLRLVETSQGVTAVPAHDHYLSSKRRKNKGKEKIDVNSENLQRLGPLNTSAGSAAKKRPVGVLIKEEAI